VGFKFLATVKRFLTGSAKFAFAILPCVFHAFKPDVASITGETLGDRVRATGVFRAIHASPRQQAGQVRDTNAKYLLGQNMIDAFLEIGNLCRKPTREAAGNLTQKHT
jgi:hypothetical protein